MTFTHAHSRSREPTPAPDWLRPAIRGTAPAGERDRYTFKKSQEIKMFTRSPMNRILILFLLTISVFSFMCNSDKQVEEKTKKIVPAFDGNITVSLEINITNNKPLIIGTTNLPEGTELIVSVEGKDTKFTGQDKSTIKNGKFKCGPYGPAQGLSKGKYVADVTMPYPFVQPDHVQEIIGKNGENLKGSLVEKKKLGALINYSQEFDVQ